MHWVLTWQQTVQTAVVSLAVLGGYHLVKWLRKRRNAKGTPT